MCSSTLPQVMVVTSDGFFLVYSIDYEKGGECQLLRKHSFVAADDVPAKSSILSPL